MSIIGLFTVAPQSVGTKTPAGDAAAAEGFGSLLQGAMDALAQDAASTEAAPTDASPVESTETTLSLVGPSAAPVSTATDASLVEPGATLPATDDSPESGVRAVGSETPVGGVAPVVTPTSLVELVETAAGNAVPASTSSASGPTLAATPVSTGSASGIAPVVTPTPLVEPGATLPVTDDSPESGVRAVGSETPAGSSVPVSTSSTSGGGSTSGVTPAVTPVSTSSASGVAPAVTPASTSSVSGLASATGVAQASLVEPVEIPARKPVPVSTSSTSGVGSASEVSSTSGLGSASVAAPAPMVAAQAVAPSAPVAAPVPAAPLATQLARPIFSLAAAGAGEHVMTVSVTPDNLGPVTVRAHVGPEGVRVELFAPNDLGRDAIRTIIPDLRRDLAGAGLGGNLTLSSQNQPSSDGSPQGANSGQQGERNAARETSTRASAADIGEEPTPEPGRSPIFGTNSTIDVLA